MGGSNEIFEWQVVRHLDAGYNLAHWYLGNSHDAEDAVQDSLVKAFRAFPTFRGENAKPWFLQIVRNTCLRHLQAHNVLRNTAVEEGLDSIPTHEPSPEAALIAKAEAGMVREEMEKLPTEFREVLLLREFEELSYADIAIVVGAPAGTVMSRLARARTRLMTALAARITEAPSGL